MKRILIYIFLTFSIGCYCQIQNRTYKVDNNVIKDAKNGDENAQYILAYSYYYGEGGLTVNKQEALSGLKYYQIKKILLPNSSWDICILMEIKY